MNVYMTSFIVKYFSKINLNLIKKNSDETELKAGASKVKTENDIIKLKIQELRQWFQENPNLPQKIDNILLKRFLNCMHGNVEDTKKLLELNFSIRNKHPHIFINRDIDDDNIKKVLETHDIVILPGLTPERHKIMLSRLADYDASKINSASEAKFLIMLSDCRLKMSNDRLDRLDDDTNSNDDVNISDQFADGDVQILDMSGYTMSHIARLSLSVFRINMHYMQEAYPMRLCALHVINCPSHLSKMMIIIRPFIAEGVYKKIHFHFNGMDTLYEHIPQDMLPDDYGGKAGSIRDLKMKWARILNDKRNYLMDSKQWQIENFTDKSKRNWLW